MLPCVPIFSPSFLVHDFVLLLLTRPPPPTKNKWLARPIANMWKTRDTIRNESWSWHVIYTWTLSPTIALSWLVTWSESWSVLAHSLLVLVSFAAVRARVTQCSPIRPHAWTFILSPVHIKHVEFWTCCVKYFWSRLDRYIGKQIIYLVKKRINMQSAYIIFKMFSLRLKRNLRKPDVFKFTRFEAGICDKRLTEVPRL